MDFPTNNQPQGGYRPPNISTGGVTFFDGNGTMLRFGILDDTFSLGIRVPIIGDDGRKKYPKENQTSLIITPERAAGLYRILMEDVIPTIDAGGVKNKGIFYNKDKTAILDWMVTNGKASLVFYDKINLDRTCENALVFTFEKFATIEGYKKDGSGEPVITEMDANLYLFSLMLKGVLMTSFSGSAGHSARLSLNWQMKQLSKNLYAIAEKVGAILPSSNGGYNRDEGLPFGNSVTPVGTMDTMAAVGETSLDALMGM